MKKLFTQLQKYWPSGYHLTAYLTVELLDVWGLVFNPILTGSRDNYEIAETQTQLGPRPQSC